MSPNPALFSQPLDASVLAMSLRDQVTSLAALAGMIPSDRSLLGEEWYALLTPIAEQLRILTAMLERDTLEVEQQLHGRRRARP